MSNQVLVLDTNRKPLTPCTPGTARSLLKAGKAAVFRRFPFSIILKKEVKNVPQSLILKLDPGSKKTGIALLKVSQLLWVAELTHRGVAIKDALLNRRQLRRGRRHRKTRYRKARFLNRTHRDGWLAPSLQHRVVTTLTGCVAKTGAADGRVRDCARLLLSPCSNPIRSSGGITNQESFSCACAGISPTRFPIGN